MAIETLAFAFWAAAFHVTTPVFTMLVPIGSAAPSVARKRRVVDALGARGPYVVE